MELPLPVMRNSDRRNRLKDYRAREGGHLGKNLAFPTFSPLYCFTSPEEIARKQMLSSMYVVLPFIYVHVHGKILVLLAAVTIFNLDLEALICFITVCLNHLKTEKNLSKCKRSL